MKKRKSKSMHRYFKIRIIVLGLAIWLAFCGLITWMGSLQYLRYMEERAYNILDEAIDGKYYKSQSETSMLYSEGAIGRYLRWNYQHSLKLPFMREHDYDPSGAVWTHEDQNGVIRRSFWKNEELLIHEEIAYVIRTGDMELTSRSHMIFPYVSESNWLSGSTESEDIAVVYVDIPYGTNFEEYFSTKGYGHIPSQNRGAILLRLTGYFDTNDSNSKVFYPVSIDVLVRDDIPVEENQFVKYGHLKGIYHDELEAVNQNDRLGTLSWGRFAAFDTPTEGKQLQTIYAWDDICAYNHMYEPFSMDGEDYEDLVAYIERNIVDKSTTNGTFRETVVMVEAEFDDFSCTIALHCWPLQYVLTHAWPTYLISLLLAGVCICIVLRKITLNLTKPLEDMCVNHKIIGGSKYRICFPEIVKVDQRLQDADQKLAEVNMEIKRLNTALGYAQDAEENRRQLVSNLTHDLKTPIAVIHSYVEGLQEGIAKDKQDHYLSVITEESERLDAMVLQMLDFSRLEAGKVRLATDQFSLLTVLQEITDRFTPMLETKNIALVYEQTDDLTVIADEARIGQALSNLVENAVKYCPTNGTISINLTKTDNPKPAAQFTIENPTEPLSREAMEKVWSDFYRTDSSRKEPGTGLGLAIVKGIIDMHGGTCTVRNITKVLADGQRETKVEFGFTLPMN